MIGAAFLVEWTLRSSLLIITGAALVWICRVNSAPLRVAVWSVILAGSFLIPVVQGVAPALPMSSVVSGVSALTAPAPAAAAPPVIVRVPRPHPTPTAVAQWKVVEPPDDRNSLTSGLLTRGSFVWLPYLAVAAILCCRLLAGLVRSRELRRRSVEALVTGDGIEVRESTELVSPVTVGIRRPIILLPWDWREWPPTTLNAVLAHESAHVRRRDPALQMLSLIHRSVHWFNPLSWFLHRRIVEVAEDASDDVAVAATGDAVVYADVLLRFLRHAGPPRAGSIAMATYGSAIRRIDRVLSSRYPVRVISPRITTAMVSSLVVVGYLVAAAQPQLAFEVADVHLSTPPLKGSVVQMEGGETARGGRYEVRNATLVDLIRVAYGVDATAVIGGPSWLAVDRFDVIGKLPDPTSDIAVKEMLRSLLRDRFKLVASEDTRPMPAWVLTRGRTSPRLRSPRGAGQSGCEADYDRDRLSCHSVTMDAFVEWLRAGPSTILPVINQTGIEGPWDFELEGISLSRARGVSENNPIIEAIDRQLGLTLRLQPTARAVVLVSSVERRPTENEADVETRLPAPPVEFEVATIKPCERVDLRGWRSSPSGFVATGCQPLSMLVSRAWSLGQELQSVGNRVVMTVPAEIPGAPGWLASTHFEIVAKAPVSVAQVGDAAYRTMLRNLLTERFKMVTHYETRPTDVYVVKADRPKLTPADSSRRSGCRSTGLVFGGPTIITCYNVTMSQVLDTLNSQMSIAAGGRPLVDETGLQGTWDVTLSYQTGPAAPTAAGQPADPRGDVSPLEALERLGFELEKAKRDQPVFIIDHVERNPVEN
jgi:uncharacterized protein (TIGR03435 family)